MPNKDGTGPKGLGSMTGRGNGRCGHGQQNRMGRGLGRGYGNRLNIPSNMSGTEQKIDSKDESK
jgi:hypothetical protein